jgi:SCY1-like protein 2
MFYKSLPQVIDKLPMVKSNLSFYNLMFCFFKRVNLQRITSALELEFINPEMVPFVLPNMFLIAVCLKIEFVFFF